MHRPCLVLKYFGHATSPKKKFLYEISKKSKRDWVPSSYKIYLQQHTSKKAVALITSAPSFLFWLTQLCRTHIEKLLRIFPISWIKYMLKYKSKSRTRDLLYHVLDMEICCPYRRFRILRFEPIPTSRCIQNHWQRQLVQVCKGSVSLDKVGDHHVWS